MTFALYLPTLLQCSKPPIQLKTVIRCKGCGENAPAPVETMPSQAIIAVYPLCREQRRYLPSEVFQGRLSWQLLRGPVGNVVP
jgi:hypothetical protein